MIIKAAKRTESVSEYYFSRKLREIAEMNVRRVASGEEPVINLGIGSPDGMPPVEAVEALCEGATRESRISELCGTSGIETGLCGLVQTLVWCGTGPQD